MPGFQPDLRLSFLNCLSATTTLLSLYQSLFRITVCQLPSHYFHSIHPCSTQLPVSNYHIIITLFIPTQENCLVSHHHTVLTFFLSLFKISVSHHHSVDTFLIPDQDNCLSATTTLLSLYSSLIRTTACQPPPHYYHIIHP